jgi:FOG: HEAT repeat
MLPGPAWAKEKAQEIPAATEPSARSWQIIDEAMANHDPDKRRAIVVAASLGGANDKVINFLTDALKDKNVEVRVGACGSLASLKDKRTMDALRKAMADPVPEVFFCAAQALSALGDPTGEKVLLEVLEGKKGTASGFLTGYQREAMAAFNSKGRFLSTIFHLGIRFAPVPGLAMGFSSFEELTMDHKAGGQVIAALDLAHAKDAQSLQTLVKALGDPSPLVRAAAIHSIALRNDPSVRSSLVPLLEDKVYKVQYRAAVAYLRLEQAEKLMAQAPAAASELPPSAKK